jgi:hypothetical protein
VDVRAAARRRAAVRGPRAGREHWAACARRCGEPRDVVVGVAAVDGGLEVSDGGERRIVADVEHALALAAERSA